MNSDPQFFSFIENIDRVSKPDYVPTNADILHLPASTHQETEIQETRLTAGRLTLEILNIREQQGKIKQLLRVLNDVTCIIFVVDLCLYDQYQAAEGEEPDKNLLVEAIVLFETIANSQWFKRSSIIMVFQEVELFGNKLARKPLSNLFPEYSGGDDVKKARECIVKRFQEVNHARRSIYPHFGLPVAPSILEHVTAAVRDTLVDEGLRAKGVL